MSDYILIFYLWGAIYTIEIFFSHPQREKCEKDVTYSLHSKF